MAGFTADLNPKSNAMSLGDMMKMGLYSAETAIANRKAQIAEEQAKETPIVMQFMKDQDKYMTNGRIDLDKASLLPVIAPLTGAEQYQKLVQLHKFRTEADDAEMGLDTKQRQIVASAGETLGYAGVQDPKQYVQAYQGLKQLYPNNMNIAKLADAYSGMISTMPPGQHVAQAAIKNSVDLLSPEAKNTMMAPKAGTTTIGGGIGDDCGARCNARNQACTVHCCYCSIAAAPTAARGSVGHCYRASCYHCCWAGDRRYYQRTNGYFTYPAIRIIGENNVASRIGHKAVGC
jgi:hypothetical protein